MSVAEFKKPGVPKTDIEEVKGKFYQLLEIDRNSPEFQRLYNEVDRLLIDCMTRERKLKEA